ncbi:MAG: polysaccharide biosynthesis protein [Chitinophagaceae bacterium]|jgi:FlaA1/EpsC-like NDP-sugar epimerase|nr:polysaccharide biosynthesis protein [Chitinophagaceae bacterium]
MNQLIKERLRRDIPRGIVLSIDLYITLNSLLITYIVFYKDFPSFTKIQDALFSIYVVLCLALVSFLIVSPHKGIIRYTGLSDLAAVLKANLLFCCLLFIVSIIFRSIISDSIYHIRDITILTVFLLNTLIMCFMRIVYKAFYERYVVGNMRTNRVMIYGAGAAGNIAFRVIKDNSKNAIRIFGFIDDNPNMANKRLNGVPIFNPEKINDAFIKANHIDEIIISIPSIAQRRLNEIVDKLTVLPVKLKIVPGIDKWLNGELSVQQIKAIKIEDLLDRPSIKVLNSEIQDEVKDKVVVVTGAAGSIGSEIARQLTDYACKKLILIDQAETPLHDLQQSMLNHCNEGGCEFILADIRDKKRMDSIFRTFRPHIIFHAAAYKHVPIMESNPYESVNTNVRGTKIVADSAVRYGAEKFVMISTDKAVNPTNVMGATKRIAELYVTHLNALRKTKFVITRFGNVLGSNGSVIPIFKKQIEEGGPLTVTHKEITRYFMTIPEACQLVLEAGAMGNGGEVFVFDMGEQIKIFDLALKMIHLSGLRYPKDIDIEITGLRPGEKIYEELLADSETTLPTHHKKIMIARVSAPPEDFNEQINNLINNSFDAESRQERNNSIVQKIKDILPEYLSQNSIFTMLDKQHAEAV